MAEAASPAKKLKLDEVKGEIEELKRKREELEGEVLEKSQELEQKKQKVQEQAEDVKQNFSVSKTKITKEISDSSTSFSKRIKSFNPETVEIGSDQVLKILQPLNSAIESLRMQLEVKQREIGSIKPLTITDQDLKMYITELVYHKLCYWILQLIANEESLLNLGEITEYNQMSAPIANYDIKNKAILEDIKQSLMEISNKIAVDYAQQYRKLVGEALEILQPLDVQKFCACYIACFLLWNLKTNSADDKNNIQEIFAQTIFRSFMFAFNSETSLDDITIGDDDGDSINMTEIVKLMFVETNLENSTIESIIGLNSVYFEDTIEGVSACNAREVAGICSEENNEEENELLYTQHVYVPYNNRTFTATSTKMVKVQFNNVEETKGVLNSGIQRSSETGNFKSEVGYINKEKTPTLVRLINAYDFTNNLPLKFTLRSGDEEATIENMIGDFVDLKTTKNDALDEKTIFFQDIIVKEISSEEFLQFETIAMNNEDTELTMCGVYFTEGKKLAISTKPLVPQQELKVKKKFSLSQTMSLPVLHECSLRFSYALQFSLAILYLIEGVNSLKQNLTVELGSLYFDSYSQEISDQGQVQSLQSSKSNFTIKKRKPLS